MTFVSNILDVRLISINKTQRPLTVQVAQQRKSEMVLAKGDRLSDGSVWCGMFQSIEQSRVRAPSQTISQILPQN
jgi:hypothetical protein